MTDIHALYTRFEEHGPVNLHVSEEEYLWLLRRVRGLWVNAGFWTPREQALMLMFLRGYTFYREISEHENQFWVTFHKDLNLPYDIAPSKAQYDNLWGALNSHTETAPYARWSHGPTRDRREFVATINAVWGVHSLQARELMAFFTTYYNTTPGQKITAALMQRLMPNADDATLRQASSYDRLFRCLVQIVDHLLDTDPGLARLPAEELTAHLHAQQIEVGDPNPVKYFANKTDGGLARLVGLASQGTRHRYRFQPVRTSIRSGHAYAEAHLAPGFALAGEPVSLRLDDRIVKVSQHAELRLSTGERARLVSGAATFGLLPIGSHEAQLYIDGEPAGRSVTFHVLPPMTWSLSHRTGPLIEGQWQVGTVTLEDGRFGRFRWQPQWTMTSAAFAPSTQRIHIMLDNDLHVELDITAQCYGARIIAPDTQQIVTELQSADQLGDLVIRPLVPARFPQPALRVSWSSAPEHTADAGQGQHLRGLIGHAPSPYDELLIEMQHSTTWHRIHAIPVAVPPTIEEVTCEGHILRCRIRGAGGLSLHIQEQAEHQACEHVTPVPLNGILQIPLRLADAWAPRVLLLKLQLSGCLVAETQVHYAPRRPHLNGELSRLLTRGLGWAPLRDTR